MEQSAGTPTAPFNEGSVDSLSNNSAAEDAAGTSIKFSTLLPFDCIDLTAEAEVAAASGVGTADTADSKDFVHQAKRRHLSGPPSHRTNRVALQLQETVETVKTVRNEKPASDHLPENQVEAMKPAPLASVAAIMEQKELKNPEFMEKALSLKPPFQPKVNPFNTFKTTTSINPTHRFQSGRDVYAGKQGFTISKANPSKANLTDTFPLVKADKSNSNVSASAYGRHHEEPSSPLPERARPTSFENFFGHNDLFGESCIIRRLIEIDQLPSLILWGPPGSGKTTLAGIIAKMTKSKFVKLSAVSSGVVDIRKVVDEAKNYKRLLKRGTILFLDEIHRFNKSQQDSLLEFVENGTLKLIGATTENPVIVLNKLTEDDITKILLRAAKMEGYAIADDTMNIFCGSSDGDARRALNLLEVCIRSMNTRSGPIGDDSVKIIAKDILDDVLRGKSHLVYDRNGENHYNLISALHKSVRGGDKDASVYYLARMLESGEDPLYIARRVIRMATEDIGLGNPMALAVCVSAYQACHFIGMPECSSALTMAVVYLCESPKSNAIEIERYCSHLQKES